MREAGRVLADAKRAIPTIALLAIASSGCGLLWTTAQFSSMDSIQQATAPSSAEAQLFASLPHGADALNVLCNGPFPHDDVAGTFCQGNIPPITGLKDLYSVLHVGFSNTTSTGGNGTGGNPFFALQAGSSALARRETSSINPQSLVFQNLTPSVPLDQPNASYVAVAFTRGSDEMVEIATYDPVGEALFFYVVKFYRACDETQTCTNADYYSPAVENNWVRYDVYENEPNLQNTILDCRHCHNPGGPVNSASILRLQENTAPYTHFLWNQSAGGEALLSDFHAAHGYNEDYGPIPAALIDSGDPSQFATFVSSAGFAAQPNAFDSAIIEAQVDASSPSQPQDNAVPGTSAAWNTIFGNFLQGMVIGMPYHDVKVTDPDKLAQYTAAYQSVMNQTAPPSSMPDMKTILPDDPNILSQMSLRMVPGSTPQTILASACMECHNTNLDQTMSRARFNVESVLNGTISEAEKAIAIQRILDPTSSIEVMPPLRFRTLLDTEQQALVNYIQQQ